MPAYNDPTSPIGRAIPLKFEDIKRLRSSGNDQTVAARAYDLDPSFRNLSDHFFSEEVYSQLDDVQRRNLPTLLLNKHYTGSWEEAPVSDVTAAVSQPKQDNWFSTASKVAEFGSIGGLATKVGRGIGSAIKESVPEAINMGAEQLRGAFNRQSAGQQGTLDTTGTLLGATGSAVGKIAGDAVMGGVKAVTPNFIERKAGELVQSGAQAVVESRPGQFVADSFNNLDPVNQARVRSAAGIGELALGLAGTTPALNSAKGAVKGAVNKVDELATIAAENSAKKATMAVDNAIDTAFAKAIRPSVSGKGTVQAATRTQEQAREAVKSIAKRVDQLELTDEFGDVVKGQPQSLRDFAQAIEQAKKKVYEEYSSLAKEANVAVKVDDIATELEKIASDVTRQTTQPQVAVYASRAAKRWKELDEVTPEQAERLIAQLNESLQTFYANGTNKATAQVDASIANLLRSKLDDAIEQATGKAGYQNLKNEYGALKSIEKDVVHRAIVDARKAQKGLVDMTDIFSGGDIAASIVSLNPSFLARGVAQKGIATWIKALNDPNRTIKNMFKKVDKAVNPKVNTDDLMNLTPEERATGLIGGGGDNMPRNVSPNAQSTLPQTSAKLDNVDTNLLEEAKKYKSAEEFVKAQGTPLLHSTPKENVSSINTTGFQIGKAKGIGNKITDGIFFTKDNSTLQANTFNGKEVATIEAYLAKDARIKRYKTDTEFFEELASDKDFSKYGAGNRERRAKAAMEIMRKKGVDVIEKPYANGTETIVLDPSQIKTRTQLEDIWKQANLEN